MTIFILFYFIHNPAMFVLLTGVVLFGWGETLWLFPFTLTDTFGPKHAATNYGFLYIAQGIDSILGGPAAAYLEEDTPAAGRPCSSSSPAPRCGDRAARNHGAADHAAEALGAGLSAVARAGLTLRGFPLRNRALRGPKQARAVFRTRGLRRRKIRRQNLSVPAPKGAEQEEGAILTA